MFGPTNAQKWFNKKYPRRKKENTEDINISSKSFNTHLRLEGFPKVKKIKFEKIKLNHLEITNFPELTDVKLFNNCSIKSLTVSDCPKLTKLDCSGIKLEELEILDCLTFTFSSLICTNNPIKNLNISL